MIQKVTKHNSWTDGKLFFFSIKIKQIQQMVNNIFSIFKWKKVFNLP